MEIDLDIASVGYELVAICSVFYIQMNRLRGGAPGHANANDVFHNEPAHAFTINCFSLSVYKLTHVSLIIVTV